MDNPDSPEVSIIFPAYNEAGSIARALEAARESLAALFRIRRNYRRGVYDQPRGPEA